MIGTPPRGWVAPGRGIGSSLSTTLEAQRLSVPGAGRTIAGSLRPWSAALEAAHGLLASVLDAYPNETSSAFADWYQPGPTRGTVAPTPNASRLASSALLASWLIARSNLLPAHTVVDSEQWMTGGSDRLLTAHLHDSVIDEIAARLAGLPTGEALDDVLPYLMEVFEGNGVPTARDRGTRWLAKRETGLFYTPRDVADFIAERTLAPFNEVGTPTCLDPACGTGIFLRSALTQLRRFRGNSSLDLCSRALYGIDISEQAVQSAVFVLLSRCLLDDSASPGPPIEAWRRIRSNFAILDSTTLGTDSSGAGDLIDAAPTISEVFPSVGSTFAVVLGNPPYSMLAQDGLHVMRQRLFASAPVKGPGAAFPLFVEMMWRFTNSETSTAGMVVPLSIAYHSGAPFKALRREMTGLPAKWHFHFFDRTPDSLFGDDVKTRNAIVLMFREKERTNSVFTSSLRRWNSRKRDTLFSSPHLVRLTVSDIIPFIPKLGEDLEERAYVTVQSNRRVVGELWEKDTPTVNTSVDGRDMFHYATAYNWLAILRALPLDQDGLVLQRLPNSLKRIRCKSEDLAWFSFGVLSSRVTYWLWRVTGDGFHLTRNFLESVPFHPTQFSPAEQRRLHEASALLWREMQENPVSATNGGVTTLNFNPLRSRDVVDELDRVIVAASHLPEEFPEYLRQFHDQTILAGRDN